MITDLFIRRPVMAAVLSLILLLLGLVALPQLGVRETPQIEPPVVTVSTAWFGADPETLETEVTDVLERELNGIDGLRTITSTSRDQTSQISLEFELGHDLDEAANDVRDRVARARRNLPPDVEPSTVEKAEADGSAVVYVRVVGDRSLLELSDIADRLVRERLETISGISRVDINGERRYAMRVELDPAALAARGLTVIDVDRALQAQNVDAPAGRVEGATMDIAARVDGGLVTVEDFEALIVADRGGAAARLRDVAQVRLGAEDERSSARSDGVPSVTLSVLPQSDANIVDISDEVRRRLPQILRDLPDGVGLEINYDRSLPVRHSIRDVVLTLLLSAAMVVGVIWLFLRDLRATLIPAAAIVVSLVGTLAFQWALGFTLNVFTLFGLVLAIGVVIDDAIVVLENIWRHVEAGATPADAAIRGAREIVTPVIATTISLIVVFLPVIFTGGATGRLFLEFGGTVAIAVALSAVAALTLSPTLSARLLRAREARPEEGPVTRAFGRSLRPVLRWPWLAFAALAGSIGAGGWALWTAPREFFPTEDRNFFMVRATGPEGVGFAWMDARVRELEPELMDAVPERIAMLSRVNMARGNLPGSSNAAIYAFPLVPPAERERTQDEIARSLSPLLSGITAFRAIPIQPPTIGGGFGSAALQLVVMHQDYETLTANLPRLMEAMSAVPGLTGVDVDLKLNRPETRIVVDRDKASALGVSLADLSRTLQVLSTGIEQDQFKRDGRQYAVMLGLRRDARATTSALARVQVRAAS
ncbi:MAG TPA: efflux RND transporter permease subunit, partial [Myxococcota bacterium]|nr:efflux RND transporter permease subunit [Myxococcota bacterium]